MVLFSPHCSGTSKIKKRDSFLIRQLSPHPSPLPKGEGVHLLMLSTLKTNLALADIPQVFAIITTMSGARRFFLAAITILLLVPAFAGNVLAQTPSNPTMVGRRLDDDKEALYAQFNDYKRNPNPEQQRFA